MNLSWNIRLLRGPLRPFLVRKAVDAARERLLVPRLRRLPTAWNVDRPLAEALVPFPSDAWIQAHAHEVLAFARAMRDGRPGLPQVATWHVAASDPIDVDVRSVHELSRMHHWCAYALAAHIDAEHAQEWCALLASEIASFATTWPPEQGTHWAFPMGTALRVHSMLVAWDWARRTGFVDESMHRRVAALALDHAESVWVRRERRGGLSTSHYAANLLGILAVARYLPHEPTSAARSAFAVRELRRELHRQVLDDGMSNEASTGYHRQIVDTFVHARTLLGADAEQAGWTAEDDVQVGRAVARCAQLERLGMPLIGDNDDGMAMKLTGFAPDCSYLYDLVRPQLVASLHMPSAGIYVFEQERLRVTLRNGPVGQFGKGGHAHQDLNSVTVCVDDVAFVIDPGTSVYTQNNELRNAERSVGMHATMWWDDAAQLDAPPGENGLFWLLDDQTQVRVKDVSTYGVTAEVRRRNGRVHQRRVEVRHGTLNVHDRCAGGPPATTWFPLHPDVTIEHIYDRSVRLRRGAVQCELSWNAGELSIDTIHVSPAFGRRQSSQRLILRGVSDLAWTLSPGA